MQKVLSNQKREREKKVNYTSFPLLFSFVSTSNFAVSKSNMKEIEENTKLHVVNSPTLYNIVESEEIICVSSPKNIIIHLSVDYGTIAEEICQ